jgi:aldehyde:ferredoxin oxidoreductase
VGYQGLAGSLEEVSRGIQKLRWRMRLATGFDPQAVTIPARFSEITTSKGRLDAGYLAALKGSYARCILELGSADAASPERPGGGRSIAPAG